MDRGLTIACVVALACAWSVQASVLVPTYVLPPASFVRDQRSLASDQSAADSRTVRRLVGGHLRIRDREYGDPAKNSFAFDEKSGGSKFAGVAAPEAGASVGWNQGIWDDGMLMSSAGEGKDAGKGKKDDDEDKKTLSDQVAEGKYGLIQNEIFPKNPKRPGVVSYDTNPDTREKDNVHTLGGLKKDEIWLAEDHLLVLKGGSFPDYGKQKHEQRPWPAIDDYEAPRRQVKLPQKPLVPPPFPVRLSDDGPLVFLTPNGSIPASLFPNFHEGEGDGPLSSAPFPYPPGAIYAPGDDQRNFTSGGPPFPIPQFPFLPGNSSEGSPFPPFPFQASINGSFPEGFPPGTAFLPPPSNQTDLYDEDDPSIYYPPPYNFSYRAENGSVPPGPLVPGIVLPPPPDFFAPLEEKPTTTEGFTSTPKTTTQGVPKQKPTVKRPMNSGHVNRKHPKTRPTTTENVNINTDIPTTQRPVHYVETYKPRQPVRVVQIPRPSPVRQHNYATETPPPKGVEKQRLKVTSKPASLPVSIIYDYPDQPTYTNKIQTSSRKPYIVYELPDQKSHAKTNPIVTSTPVPLRAYYSNTQNDDYPKTKLEPVYNSKQNENALASFYFYDEAPKTTPAPATYFDGRNYYKAVPVGQQQRQQYDPAMQNGFTPSVNVAYGAVDQGDSLLIWPQKQGPRTLTQEYFSIQPKPARQQVYVQQNARPDSFYRQIADIQQTIDLFTTKRPRQFAQRPNSVYTQKVVTSRPVYQFSFQSKPRQEQVTFRAPKLDTEPFRPMVSYSKPFDVETEYNSQGPTPTPIYHQQYLVENVKVTTETPTSSKYYSQNKPLEVEYEDSPAQYDKAKSSHQNSQTYQRGQEGVTAAPEPAVTPQQRYPSTTASPVNHAYFTKQDERYFDDITKNYFDNFGKKIEDGTRDEHGVAVTAPIGTVRTPIDNGINLHYAQDEQPDGYRPPSLADDTLVNYRQPRPYLEPESEFVPIPNPAYRAGQQLAELQRQIIREQQQQRQQQLHQQRLQQQQQQPPPYTQEQLDMFRPDAPHSLAGDVAVNYKQPLPPVNPDAELLEPVNSAGEGRPGSFVSYRLPGEGAHVYFLTPQATGYRAPNRAPSRAPSTGR